MAGKTESFSFSNASFERLWQACVQAVGVLGYNVIHSDKGSGQISFNTGRSLWSWAGQDLTATLVGENGGSRLVMGGSIAKGGNPFGGGQVVAWGEKARVIEKYVNQVGEVLRSIPEAQAAPPTQAGSVSSTADELLKLARLRDSGVLTPEEFAAQKAKLLS